jgi:hypothetical protein
MPCYCACGLGAVCCAETCSPSTACITDTTDLAACATTNCATECTVSTPGLCKGIAPDSGSPTTNPTDAASATETGTPVTNPTDAGAAETGAADASPPEAGSPEAGPVVDASPVDAAPDTGTEDAEGIDP